MSKSFWGRLSAALRCNANLAESKQYCTIEDKLHALAECGFQLKGQFTLSGVVEQWKRSRRDRSGIRFVRQPSEHELQQSLDAPGFRVVLLCLGMQQDRSPWTAHCENLWHFDVECIEDNGSYVRIAQRMVEMSQGALPVSEFEDHVDIDEGIASLRFKCRGEAVHVEFAVENDWVDPRVFTVFVDLLAKYDPNKVFLYYDLGGQDCILGCATRDSFEKLKKLVTNLKLLT